MLWEDFEVGSLISENANTLVYRARRKADGEAVVLKIAQGEPPTVPRRLAYRREYAALNYLRICDGVVRTHGLLDTGDALCLILEDTGADSLSVCAKMRSLSVQESTWVGAQIATYLGAIHSMGVIHQDINPNNVIYNRESATVQIIDFGISSRIARQTVTIAGTNSLRGTPAYVSPEQTGRMNRPLDHRTDLYSLGATLYELLTGRPPFATGDILELIHAHIAIRPEPPHRFNGEIPPALSQIIIRLLDKSAERRYYNCQGLVWDLKECLRRFEDGQSRQAIDFELATHDLNDRLQIPDVLYGRDAERTTLLDGFARVCRGEFVMLMIKGHSGVGKTSLVQELHPDMTCRRGIYAAGKCGLLQRAVPYAAIGRAFHELVNQLLSESEDVLGRWRDLFKKALGTNGAIMTSIVPKLELIIGPQPPVAELPPVERQNRFNIVFGAFVNALAQPEHPLVLFLDDLQWADDETLRLLERLLTSRDTKYLYLIGAYRDNEVSAEHALAQMLDDARERDVAIAGIHVKPLDVCHVRQLVTETVGKTEQDVAALAAHVHEKTGGNPLIISELLAALTEERLLETNTELGAWEWDLDEIRKRGLTDDIVNLMVKKISRQAPATQRVVMLAAAVGDKFDLDFLAALCEKKTQQTARDLNPAIATGLIVPLGTYHELYDYEVEPQTARESPRFKFAHDRIQQAAYGLLTEAERPILHKQIGSLLLERFSSDENEANLPSIVGHLNAAATLVETAQEKLQLADLNTRAGKFVTTAAAHAAALNYFTVALRMLGDSAWQSDYARALELHSAIVDVASVSGNDGLVEAHAEIVHKNARSMLDRVDVFLSEIRWLSARGHSAAAADRVTDVLAMLGRKVQRNPGTVHILLGLMRVKVALRSRSAASIVDATAMNDPTVAAQLRVIATGAIALYQSAPNLCVYLSIFAMLTVLKYGQHDVAIFALGAVGFVLSAVAGDIETGYGLGQTSIALVARTQSSQHAPIAHLIYNVLVRHTREPLRATFDGLDAGHRAGVAVGDLDSAGYCVQNVLLHHFQAGTSLARCEEIGERSVEITRQLGNKIAEYESAAILQGVLNLQGTGSTPLELTGNACDERAVLEYFHQSGVQASTFNVYAIKLCVRYILGDYEGAIEVGEKMTAYEESAIGAFALGRSRFFYALALLAAAPSRGRKRRAAVRRARSTLRQLRKWARHCPDNHAHAVELLDAEVHRVCGNWAEAVGRYERAMELATRSRFVHEEALAFERAGTHFFACGHKRTAGYLLGNARRLFKRWGAKAKVQSMDDAYGQVLSGDDVAQHTPPRGRRSTSNPETTGEHLRVMTHGDASDAPFAETVCRDAASDTIAQSSITHCSTSSTSGTSTERLDLDWVVKASQAISSELVQERLLATLMRIVAENGGATRGALVIREKEEFVVRAEVSVEKPAEGDTEALEGGDGSNAGMDGEGRTWVHQQFMKTALPDVPLDEHKEICHAAVRYVLRSRDSVLLTDAANVGQYTRDPYVLRARPLSLLCMPVMHHGKVTGVLYLENDNVTEAFTSERVRTLGVLCTQAAISLEAARLYKELSITLEEAEEANRLKSDFLANISHELRTPINAILNVPTMLLQDFPVTEVLHCAVCDEYFKPPPKGTDHCAPAIHDCPDCGGALALQSQVRFTGDPEAHRRLNADATTSGRHLLGVVDDLLDFSRLEAGRMQLHLEQVDANEVAKEVKRTLDTLAEEKSQALQLVATEESVLLRADRVKVMQILINIAGNAIKFTDHGGRISISVSRETNDGDAMVVFAVADTGPGIAKEAQEAIFDRFRQLDGGHTRGHGGTGLGLAITKSLAELHDGSIRLESAVGAGSTFTISLPVGGPTDRQVNVQDTAAVRIRNALDRTYRVIVVDDDRSSLELVGRALSGAGFDVELIASPKEAMRRILREPIPDAVVLDIMMPEISGLTLLRVLRENEATRNVRAIVCSGYRSNREIVGKLGGMWVQKPWTAERLLRAVADPLLQV